jgi:hypothetical protein
MAYHAHGNYHGHDIRLQLLRFRLNGIYGTLYRP